MERMLKDSSETGGNATGPQNPTVNGVEFGLRPRKRGVFYTESFPPGPLYARLMKDGIYCVGLDSIDGKLWRRWEITSITCPHFKKRGSRVDNETEEGN